MRRYILKRVGLGIITVIGVTILVFLVSRLTGDVALLLAPEDATDAEIEAIRVHLGLDKSLPEQYFIFLINAFQGDFGRSITWNQPAMQMMLQRVPATLQLGITAFIIGNIIGISFGAFFAYRRGTLWDKVGKIFALMGQAIPSFYLAVMLILVFGVELGWLPTSGRGSINQMIMPAACLSLFPIAFIMRVTRSSMLDVLDSEYIKMARIKGNPERIVVMKHALRNALIPVCGMMGMQLAHLISGSVIIETIFRWPGVGRLMVTAIFARDYALVQAAVLLISIFVISVNLIVDLLYGYIDPRIRYD